MQTIASQTKKCQFCSETIQATAIKCRFCGEFLDTVKAKALKASSLPHSPSGQGKKQTDRILFKGRPSLWAMAGAAIRGLFFLGLAAFLMAYPLEELSWLGLTQEKVLAFGKYRLIAGPALAILVVVILLLKTIKLKMTYYEVSADRIEWSRGILDRKVDNLDMFRVVDLRLRRNLLDCIFGIGTVMLITTDKTDPEFVFEKIRNSRRLYDCIKNASLVADRRDGVIHLE